MRSVHQDQPTREREFVLDLDEIARQGARKMLAQALEAEVDAYLLAAEGARDERGRALVVRNGHARSREVICGAGAIEVRAPRVNDKRLDGQTGERKRFKSSILPPYMRRSPKVSEVLPLLYLHGLSPAATSPRPSRSSSAPRPVSRRPPWSGLLSSGERSARRFHGARALRERLRLCVGGRYTYQGQARPR